MSLLQAELGAQPCSQGVPSAAMPVPRRWRTGTNGSWRMGAPSFERVPSLQTCPLEAGDPKSASLCPGLAAAGEAHTDGAGKGQ